MNTLRSKGPGAGNRHLTWHCSWSPLCSHGPRIRNCQQPSHRPVSRGKRTHICTTVGRATPGQPCPGVALPRPPPGITRTPSPFHLPAVKWMMGIQAAIRIHKTRAAPGTGHRAHRAHRLYQAYGEASAWGGRGHSSKRKEWGEERAGQLRWRWGRQKVWGD